jgi:hypothetical protein
VIRQRKDQKTVNVKILKILIGRLRPTFFRIMKKVVSTNLKTKTIDKTIKKIETQRLFYEQNQLRENYFNHTF